MLEVNESDVEFKDGELVVSEPGLIPYMKSDIVKVGENNGLNGGICNVVYYTYKQGIRRWS